MSSRSRLLLFAVLLAFLALRLPPMLRQPGRIDEECYAVPGLTILRTGLPQLPHFPSRNPRSMFYQADVVLYAEPPLYFYLQAGLYSVLPPSYATARMLSALASILILWRVYELTRRWSGSDAAGLWGAGLLGLSRWFHYAAMIARPDIVCTLFGVLAIEAADRWSEKPAFSRLALCGLWLGLGGLTHPLAIVFAIQCAIWVLWNSRGWARLTQPGLLAGITLAVFSLWLPLILLHPDIFWKQFDNQFVTADRGSALSWLANPVASIWLHLSFFWKNLGWPQTLLVLLTTLACMRPGKPPLVRRAGFLSLSAILLLMLLSGSHHEAPGYWAYPGALGFICVGIVVANCGAWLANRWQRTGRILAGLLIGLLLAGMLPGSGARLFAVYVRHWNDTDYNSRAFAQELLQQVSPEARCAVAGEFVLDFLAAGRPVLGIPSQPIYFDINTQPLDLLVISRDSPTDLTSQLCTLRESTAGNRADPFACWAELHHVPESPCE